MECTSEECKRRLKKRLCIIHGSINDSSESSFSSDSETHYDPFNYVARRRRRESSNSKRDYLSKLFERKKLKDKSLSKKLKTPFDRKINRTCWPIHLRKVTKIKKKPREKKREKPTYRSLTRRKASDLRLISNFRDSSPQITCSELEFFDDDSFNLAYTFLNKKHYLYEQVKPEMLMAALQDPEFLETGATIDMIITKLKTMNLSLNPIADELKDEISIKLHCAIRLGLVVEIEGHYRLADAFRNGKQSMEKIQTIWRWWYSRMEKMRR